MEALINSKKEGTLKYLTSSPKITSNVNSSNPEKKNQSFIPIKIKYSPDLTIEKDDIDLIICGLCSQICDEPVITGCGCQNIFCKKCLEYHYNNHGHTCPKCKKKTGMPTYVKIIDNIIKNKRMKCVNCCRQCNWERKLKDYLNHIQNECLKKAVTCPDKGYLIKLKREDKYICDKCDLQMPLGDKLLHKSSEVCKCELEMEDFNLQTQQCKCSIINCPFTDLGCTDTFQKKFEKERLDEDVNIHLILCAKKIMNLEERIKILEGENKELKRNKEDQISKKNNNYGLNFANDKSKINTSFSKEKKIINLDENEDKNEKKINYFVINKIPEEKNNNISMYIPEKKLINNKRKNKNKSIYSNDDNSTTSRKLKKINSKEKEVIKNVNDKIIFKIEKIIYDLIPKTEHLFRIKNNIIQTESLKSDKQYYVFFNKRYNIPKHDDKIYKIKYKLLKDTLCLGMGICDKKIVENNEYDFVQKNEQKNKKNKYRHIFDLY